MTIYDDDDDPPPPRRRENIMDRRLRKARGEDIEDDIDYDDDYDDGPVAGAYTSRRYARPAPVPVQGNGCAQTTLYLVLGGIAVLLLGMFFFSRVTRGVGDVLGGVVPNIQAIVSTPTTTLRLNSAAVVQRVQQLNRLESTSFTIEKVIEAGVEGNILYNLLYQDRLLLIAHGTVVAGVDLSKLKESDVTISADGQTVTLRMPPAEILSAALDNSRTRIYQRDQAILAENQNLETQARQAAEAEILKAACEGNIMQKATEDSQQAVEQLFRLAEFKQVVIQSSTPAPCVQPSAPGVTPVP